MEFPDGGAYDETWSTVFRVKTVKFPGGKDPVPSGREVLIVLQNENGPCPLIAAANVLFLRGDLQLPAVNAEHVTLDNLVSILAGYMLDRNSRFMDYSELSNTVRANAQQNIADAISMLPTLSRGLDVNVGFKSISDFEYTKECNFFDILDLNLVHGWLVDPMDVASVEAVRGRSYNQIVERIMSLQSRPMPKECVNVPPGDSNEADELAKALAMSMEVSDVRPREPSTSQIVEEVVDIIVNSAVSGDECPEPKEHRQENQNTLSAEEVRELSSLRTFLETSASQLTYHGLAALHQGMKENQLAILFRNNHFSTIYKREGAVYILVTDEGFANESGLVWERLEEVDGDAKFYTWSFEVYVAREIPPPTTNEAALSGNVTSVTHEEGSVTSAGLSDHQLALQLQIEEDAALALRQQEAEKRAAEQLRIQQQQQQQQQQMLQQQQQAQQQHRTPQNPGSRRPAAHRGSKSNCTIM